MSSTFGHEKEGDKLRSHYYSSKCIMPKTVDIPIELYKSVQGEYFMGFAEGLSFDTTTGAWARLYNPINSCVNLFVNVWTVTDITETPFRAEFYFNATPPGVPINSNNVTPTNTALCPSPIPKVQIQYATNVTGNPIGGAKAFIRDATPETTLVDSENGKLIFPPGGSFLVFISTPELGGTSATGRVAFGWWEESIYDRCIV